MWSGYKDKCLEYFFVFSTKNLEGLSGLLTDDAYLRDWENNSNNKADTMAVYKKIFDTVDTIAVTPLGLYQDGPIVVAELWITIDGKEQFFVTDVITFDETTDLISSIRAYRGF